MIDSRREECSGVPVLLRLIDERSVAFRAAAASAPSLDVRVPTCPEWTLFDLVQHLGEGRRSWAARRRGAYRLGQVRIGGPGCASGARGPAGLVGRIDAAATGRIAGGWPGRRLLDVVGTSQSPQTCGAVARHQLQEIAVHTYDAQVALGAPQSLPVEAALDGVDEFLSTCCATTAAWPHEPAAVDYHTTEGRSWRLWLSADGARTARLPKPGTMFATAAGEDPDAADASARGTASDLLQARDPDE
ncbi:maleylpyruvate isomerase family mycothiol-dependent enzyme [Micromonospora sp. CB01531]|uniref:maleylpyruvate isomerase family mycothiol-dependent enzyme n=1 Tax=Micromonospora sp. CB01531 TaxID=1718947 RepID=UPI001F51DEF0|nr:maleylpyruvate isomerase family mycothiol-dependent enzyme [Micromonospora sp. CB01531]